jgi:3-deoxy-7-phosphoheptulonate synthase
MLVVMSPRALAADIERVCEEIARQGFKPLPMPGATRTAIGLLGDDAKVDWGYIEGLPGVASVLIVQKPFRQASREWKPENTVVEIAPGVRFGDGPIPVVAWPCAAGPSSPGHPRMRFRGWASAGWNCWRWPVGKRGWPS